jgi:hypothetical protein
MDAKEMILNHIKELDKAIGYSRDSLNKAILLNAKSNALLALRTH